KRLGASSKSKQAHSTISSQKESYKNKKKNEASHSIYCKAKVERQDIKLILDSGSSGSVVMKKFLEKVRRKINQSSNINIIDIHSRRKKALEEVTQLPIVIKNAEFSINIVVTDIQDYDVLVSN